MTYEKNPYFWDADNVKIEKLEFMLSADDTAIFSAYNAGDVDFIDTVPTDEVQGLIDSQNPEFKVIDELGTYYIAFNVNSKLFEGKTPEQAAAMRHAFSILIDRQYIVDAVGQTGQQPAGAFIPAGMADGNGGVFMENDDDYTYPVTWDFNGEESVGYYDPTQTGAGCVEEAIELLKEAGFEFTDDGMLSDSTPITVEYLTNDGTGHVAIAQSIQQDLAVVGINMEIKSEEWNVFLNDRKNGQFDFAREGWLADYNDPINMLEMWLTDSGNNDAQFGR
jgi:peptide/nickel transport system substrate-binding protein/oligopeptide transport system substrate-binding protein